LVLIDDEVDGDGYLSMGVCGWEETGTDEDEDGDYYLAATTNIQGDLLESLGLRENFMHFEIERSGRDDYHAGSGDGYDGITGLFDAIETVLSDSFSGTTIYTGGRPYNPVELVFREIERMIEIDPTIMMPDRIRFLIDNGGPIIDLPIPTHKTDLRNSGI
jgi:hypothetical protein